MLQRCNRSRPRKRRSSRKRKQEKAAENKEAVEVGQLAAEKSGEGEGEGEGEFAVCALKRLFFYHTSTLLDSAVCPT